MRIGIDIDDTIAEYSEGLKGFIKKRKGWSYVKLEKIPKWALWEMMLEFSNSEEYDKIKPVKGVKGVIRKLQPENELVLITARTNFRKTRKWINNHFKNNFSKIRYTRFPERFGKEKEKKSEILQKEKIEIYIEDKKEEIEEIVKNNKKVKLILFGKRKEFENERVEVANSWDKVEKIIRNWYPRQESNLHATRTCAPKAHASASSATRA